MSHRYLLAAALLAGVCASDALAHGRKAGSCLIYPVHRSGPRFFTIVCVTNINRAPRTPISLGGSTNVHFEYANVIPNAQGYVFKPYDCTIFDRIEFLTPADTLCVLTACHNPTTPGGQEGYLVVTAEDPTRFQTPWSHNYLIGSEIVTNSSGVTYSVEALSFKSPLADGQATDVNPANQKRDFNGQEYEAIPDVLYLDSFVALAGSHLALINLTGNARAENTLLFQVWNDNEYPLSTTLIFNCWFDQPLAVISPMFTQDFLRSLPNDPRELDINCDTRDDLETGWASIQSIGVTLPGGASISSDGAILGCMTSGITTVLGGGRLLWESDATQDNGSFFNR